MTMVATGGGDGNIGLIEEPVAACQQDPHTPGVGAAPRNGLVTVDVQAILDSLPTPQAADGGHKMISRRYDFVRDDRILAIRQIPHISGRAAGPIGPLPFAVRDIAALGAHYRGSLVHARCGARARLVRVSEPRFCCME